MIERGTVMFYPSQWDCGTLDSVLTDSYGNVIAYILEKEDGSKVAVDMQITEALDDE